MKNLLPWMTPYGFPHHDNRSFAIARDDALPSPSLRQQILHIRFGWRLNVLYKDHGAGRQKEMPAHVVRLMIPACRNDLIVKEYLACSWQLTADSFYLLTAFLTTAANSSLALTRGRLTFPVIVTLSFNRHSEWTQECFVRKTGNRTVTQSEESITLNDILRFSSTR